MLAKRRPDLRTKGRRLLAVLLAALTACAALLALAPAFEGAAGESAGPYPSPDLLDGIHNINLTYTFATRMSNNNRHSKSSLLHDVGYYDKSGKLVDTFMDAYLFLPCVTYAPSGGTMYESSDPANASDWLLYLDDLFQDGYNVAALDAAVAEVGAGLGMPDYKVKVFFTILFPHNGQTGFGTLDGSRQLDFSKQADRAAAVDWLLDEEVRRFKAGGYKHLELTGFYWFEEFINYDSERDLSLVKHFNQKVHAKGYKSIWIPYYHARGYNHIDQFGFDVVCMQPNLMWMDSYDRSRVGKTVQDCALYGMSMEMEMDNTVLSSKYNRFISYLRGGVASGINRSINMYYQGSRFDALYYAKNSTSEQGRSVYDLTYRYAKGILTLEELPPDEPDFSVPKGYSWIQVGKTYTASAAYVGDGTLVYQDVDGKELTDGIFGSSVWSTDFHAFHTSHQEPAGGYAITVDLGEPVSRIGAFVLDFGRETASGIGVPYAARVSVSDDGERFRDVGDMTISFSSSSADIGSAVLESELQRARYVRVTMDKGSSAFVFCSELMIGVKKRTSAALRGDVNDDGDVSAIDYLLIKRHVVGTIVLSADEQAIADLNGDGEIDVRDYTGVKRIVLGTA